MMAEQQKSIFIRFNMDDKNDRELYMKLTGEAGSSASLTAYVKRVLEEYFTLNIRIADRQEFHSQMLSVVREEMQSQGMKLVGALLAGIGTGVVPVQRKDSESAETALPEVCEKLPDELSGVLDFIR
ncbi:MAG: hypothetical protein HFH87_12745 [Lachnospiraceae bacterium]|nr:hypothetical protein [Lachnospiraceae bacterium]